MLLRLFDLTETPKGGEFRTRLMWLHFLEFGHDKGEGSTLDAQGDYPLLTPMTSELRLHVEALQTLFAGEQPLMIPIRPTDRGKLRFYCGDASREGFGGVTQYPDGTLSM